MKTQLLAMRPSLMVAASLAILLIWPGCIWSQDDLSRDEAERRLDNLLTEISELKENLETARSEFRREQSQLKEIDLEIDDTSRQSRAIGSEMESQRAELARLEDQRAAELEKLAKNRDQLADVLRSSYRLDRHSRLKLVLNQDDPARLGRMLAYYEYFNRQHVENIALLRQSLEALERTRQGIARVIADLEDARRQLGETMQRLDAQRLTRVGLLSELDDRIDSEEARLEQLEQDRADLVRLLERLEDALSDIPADLGAHLSVAQQKGQLPMPVGGRVLHAFGQQRVGTLHWQGWLIGADPGTTVRSVAYGRVAFSDWLRGYGLMLIIDHGGGFLSLYGNNESLLVEVGDWVEPGGTIAVVGSNPGMNQGLYFELRKDGKAVDPAAWIKR